MVCVWIIKKNKKFYLNYLKEYKERIIIIIIEEVEEEEEENNPISLKTI